MCREDESALVAGGNSISPAEPGVLDALHHVGRSILIFSAT